MIDDGDIITAGGVMACDIGLMIIDRLLGPTAMTEKARYLLVDPLSREQRHYSSFSPKLNHGDNAILKVQYWLRSRGVRKISIGALAECAGLEKRTFLRRFQRATGLRPTEYCQHLRVGRARQMLESSSHPISQIAWDVGYRDVTAFRTIFVRVTGLSPIDYRERFRADIDRNGAELG
jgi:transcriptional regulator GlxA family with amidase domain